MKKILLCWGRKSVSFKDKLFKSNGVKGTIILTIFGGCGHMGAQAQAWAHAIKNGLS